MYFQQCRRNIFNNSRQYVGVLYLVQIIKDHVVLMEFYSVSFNNDTFLSLQGFDKKNFRENVPLGKTIMNA